MHAPMYFAMITLSSQFDFSELPDGELERLEVGEVERVPVGVRLIWSGLMGGEIGGIPSWRVEPERERPEPF